MIDLNSLTLYQKKINSYIDENVLTFPTQSKINSLFNEVHKYKIVIFNKPSKDVYYYISAVSKLKLFRNDQELTVKSISNNSIYDATAILTDGEHNYTITLDGGSVYESNSYYSVRNAFNSGWISYISPTNMTLEFEMDRLTEISYCAGEYNDWKIVSNDNTITVFCDDEQIYSKDTIILNATNRSQIHINFNDYDDVNVTYTV